MMRYVRIISFRLRILIGIYQTLRNNKMDKNYVKSLMSKLKEEIMRVLNNKNTEPTNRIKAVATAASSRSQYNYVNTGRYNTVTQQRASMDSIDDAKTYTLGEVLIDGNI